MKDMKEFESYKNYSTTEEFKKTVALGLYQRFCKENEDNPSYSSVYLKSDRLDYEHFVADIMQYRYGENVFVTQGSGDFGVDIEHGNGEGKVLGQVKCKRKDEMYEPIAIIHSNMVKQGASRGYVVNT